MDSKARSIAKPMQRKKAALAAAVAVSAGAFSAPADATGTLAGTQIVNVATATYDTPNGAETSVDSNTIILKVDELLDVGVASGDSADIATQPGLTGQILKFTITNAGNGQEAFTLATVANGGGDDFDPDVTTIVLDANANGAYDAGVDTVYASGSNDPDLGPDQSLAVFVLSSIPASAADGARGRIDLSASARTGSGAPGTSFAGLGQGGGNAVAGASGARAEDDGWFRVAKASLAFVKSAAVADLFGGTSGTPGATITYTLSATVSGTGSLPNLKVSDAIPAGTSYRAGTITLDGSALSDAADADPGTFTGTGIAVGLGNVAAGTTRTITFQVKID